MKLKENKEKEKRKRTIVAKILISLFDFSY